MKHIWRAEATVALEASLVYGLVSLPLGLVIGRPELVVVGAPFALAAVLVATSWREPEVRFELTAPVERVIEGLDLDVQVRITASHPVTVLVDVEVVTSGARIVHRLGAAADAGAPAVIEVPVDTARWGARRVTLLTASVSSTWGLVRHRCELADTVQARVLPTARSLDLILAPSRTRTTLGNLPSRDLGAGIEFAGTRAYRPGDDRRWVNWRVSARRGELWVNESHPERSADVVLFLDALRDVSLGSESDGSIAVSVRAADAIASAYLKEQARVGTVSFGSAVRWLAPGMGRRQGYRIIETLIDSDAIRAGRRIPVEAIPPRAVPGQALVMVLSPLMDHRILAVLTGLRARGQELVVLDLGAPADQGEPSDTEARLIRLGRLGLRTEIAAMGIPVAPWRESEPLEPRLAYLGAWRRRAVAHR